MMNKFAKYAIDKIAVITMLTTNHVLPYIFASSVIPLVSINIKPTPRKKLGYENLLKLIFVKFFKKNHDIRKITEIKTTYETG